MNFFKNHGPFKLSYLIKKGNFIIKNNLKDNLIYTVSNLYEAKKNDLTFFDNVNYVNSLQKSKASYCLIKDIHKKYLPKSIIPIFSSNPLLDFILIAKVFYPEACYDKNDFKHKTSNEIKKLIKTNSKNIIIGKNARIGKNLILGNNTIIKDNCIIGDNVRIGSNCVISNSIIGDNTEISDNSVIGKKGFGFKKINNQIEFIPHFGKVRIGKNCFIGACVTIDRGSFNDTCVDDYSYIDNHVQIAHNVKIGKYCFLAAQSGIAGSSIIGNNCLIGGQAGISGHLIIGDNVSIGGGSGVLSNIKSNEKVMGYPASNFRNFIKENKNVN